MIYLHLVRKKKAGIPPEVSAWYAELGRRNGAKGGKARAAKMTPEQRSAAARKAVQARWAKVKALDQVAKDPSE